MKTDREWSRAVEHALNVQGQYISLMGLSGAMVGPALMLAVEPVLRRYNGGERTDDLYEAMMALE